MKKLAITLGSLLVLMLIVFIGLPGMLGGQVANRLNQIADEDIFGEFVKLKVVDVEKGWFRSQARLSVEVKGPLAAFTGLGEGSREPMVFDVELIHGPLLFGEDATFGLARFVNTTELPLPEEAFEGSAESFNLKTALTLKLGGGTDLFVSSKARHYSMVDRSSLRPNEIQTRFEIDWSGFEAHFTVDDGVENLEVSIDLPNGLFEVTEKNITSPIRYGAIKLRGDYEMWRGYPAFGTGSFRWEGLDVNISDPSVNVKFELQRLLVSGDTTMANGIVSFGGNLELAEFKFDSKETGPLVINSAGTEASFTGIKEAVYGELIELQRQAPLAMMGMIGSRDFDRRGEATTKQIFMDGFEFTVPTFDMTMAPGALHYDHVFRVPAGAITDIEDPASAKAIDYSATFWIDRALAIWISEFGTKMQMSMFGGRPSEQELRDMAEQTIGGMVSEGYLKENGKRLETKLEFKNGIFRVGDVTVEDLSGS